MDRLDVQRERSLRFTRSALVLALALIGGGLGLGIAGCREPDDGDDLEEETAQAATPKTYDVMADAATPTKYAGKCGLTTADDLKLPDLAKRGTKAAADIGKDSNGWVLVQHFNKDVKCLASGSHLFANLWHKTAGGREWYYLYRYEDSDGTKMQENANGLLGFDDTSICAMDKLHSATNKGAPPAGIADLYYAGQFEDPEKMDDCSDCHVMGYNAPRPKTYAVAKGDDRAKPWLKVQWIKTWKKYADAYGPIWKLGKAPTNYKWTSGAGAALVTPPAECRKNCHENSWVPARGRDEDLYCDSVFGEAFSAEGSMTKKGSDFLDNTTCKAFINAIGCGMGRPGGAPNLTSLCPTAFAPQSTSPLINDRRMMIQGVQVVNATTVHVFPAQNTSIEWPFTLTTEPGDPWVDGLQVWGSPTPASITSALTSMIPVSNPNALPAYLQVTGLVPGVEYQLQLHMKDLDGTSSWGPLVYVQMPPDEGPDGGMPDGGVPDGGVPDGGMPDSGMPDGGMPDSGMPDSGMPDSGMPDGGMPDGPRCWLDAAPDGGLVPCPDAGPDGGMPDGGMPDSGMPDSGMPDASIDAGVPDAGPGDGCRGCHSSGVRPSRLNTAGVCEAFLPRALAPRR